MIIKELPIDQIQADPDQPRLSLDKSELSELAASMRELGQLQPVIAYSAAESYMLLDGHRRHQAALALKWSSIHAIALESKPTAVERLRMQLTANCMRSDLKPSELAGAILKLKESLGYSNVEVADYLKMSKSKVTQVLAYLTLPAEIMRRIDTGELAGSTAYAIARTSDPVKRGQLLQSAMAGKLKRRDALPDRKSPRRDSVSRFRFALPTADVSVAAQESLSLQGLIDLYRQLIKQMREAQKQKLDVRTFERVLATQKSHATTEDATLTSGQPQEVTS